MGKRNPCLFFVYSFMVWGKGESWKATWIFPFGKFPNRSCRHIWPHLLGLLAMSLHGRARCCFLLNTEVSRGDDSPGLHSDQPPDTHAADSSAALIGCQDGVTSVESVSKHCLPIASQAPVFCTCHVALARDILQMFTEWISDFRDQRTWNSWTVFSLAGTFSVPALFWFFFLT